MTIALLSDGTVNRIAAGEVVDRPAAVVRELVDNAVDADASDILVEIEDGGQALIRVVDNGIGMNAADARMCFERHATSKIVTAEDLEAVETMGFRGEALSSIASVARVRLLTREKTAAIAEDIRINGGAFQEHQQSPAACGTTFEVRQLFFNTPARKKFLKQPRTEAQKVKAWLLRAALAQPQIRFRMLQDGKEVLNFPAVSSTLERAKTIFRGSVIPFEREADLARLIGIVGHPALAETSTKTFVLLVNGRVVQDRMLLRAVKDGFDATLKDKEYPIGFLSLYLPPDELDVNVHPQKSEVRFRRGQELFGLVRNTILRAVKDFSGPVHTRPLAPQDWNPKIDQRRPRSDEGVLYREFSDTGGHGHANSSEGAGFVHEQVLPYSSSSGRAENAATVSGESGESGEFLFSELRYIGQALSCYLVCELRGEMYVVDMHAAHERYTYNLVRQAFRERPLESQALLVPLPVELPEGGVEQILEHQELMARLGFELEAFGNSTILVRSVPSAFVDADVSKLLTSIASADLPEEVEGRVGEQIDHLAARMACHASVRSGDSLSREEVYALFSALDKTEFRSACPHGRPVIVRFSRDEIDAWFGRDR